MALPVSQPRRRAAREQAVAAFFSRVAHAPIRYAVQAALAGLVVGGIVFSLIEDDTSLVDGVWWAFISMTTVGYGDLAPKTTEIRLLATFVIVMGIAATAILTAALAGKIAETRLVEHGITLDLDDDFDDIAARLSELKTKYQHDERHDDLVLVHAREVCARWESTGSPDGIEEAIADLRACVDTHPENRGSSRA